MSAVSRKFQSQSLIFDEKLLLMDQRMTTITLKEQQQPESEKKLHQLGNRSSNEIEELGLTLWKTHVSCDEQRIAEQRKFLRTFSSSTSSHLIESITHES